MIEAIFSFIITLILILVHLITGSGDNDISGDISDISGDISGGISGDISGGISGGISGDSNYNDNTSVSIYNGGGSSIQNKLARKYNGIRKKAKLVSRIPFDKYCSPRKFSLQPQQIIASDYVGSGNSLLIYHRIGAGKTCLSIQCGLKRLKYGKPVFIMPASLIPGWWDEVNGNCSDGKLTEDNCKVYSYNKFSTEESSLNRLKPSLIVIDEVQNITGGGTFYKSALRYILKHPNTPVVLMSATPIFDRPDELVKIANLLRINVQSIEPNEIRTLFDGKVSYYAGAPSHVFPEVRLKIQKCVMSRHQAKWFRSDVKAEITDRGGVKLSPAQNDFYINSRQRSNIAYPQGLKNNIQLLKQSNLEQCSAKFSILIKRLLRGKLSFVYSGFTGGGGIAAIVRVMELNGFRDYFKHGPGRRRFAVWSGDQSAETKRVIRNVFNDPANDNSSQMQVIIGSPSIKEGVSLLRVRVVHVMEAYWNHSRLEQIYGRAVRYCSHKRLEKEDRRVSIYLYCGITDDKSLTKTDPMRSIDYYMLSLADEKEELKAPYLRELMNVAIDRQIYYA